MPETTKYNVLLAKVSETEEDGRTKITIEQDEIPVLIMRLLSGHFGGCMQTGYTPGDAFLESLPREVLTIVRKLHRANRSLGITLYQRVEDKDGASKQEHGVECDCDDEDFPFVAGALVVYFRNKPYLLAQWQSGERAPIPISELKKRKEDRIRADIESEFRQLKAYENIVFEPFRHTS